MSKEHQIGHRRYHRLPRRSKPRHPGRLHRGKPTQSRSKTGQTIPHRKVDRPPQQTNLTPAARIFCGQLLNYIINAYIKNTWGSYLWTLKKTVHFLEIHFCLKYSVCQHFTACRVCTLRERLLIDFLVSLRGQIYKVEITCHRLETRRKSGVSDNRAWAWHFSSGPHKRN